MNWFDIVIIVILVLGALSGMREGLIGAVFTGAGVYIGWLLAGQYSGDLGELFEDSVSNDTIVTVISYAIIIIAAVVVARIAVKFVRPALTLLTLGLAGMVDKLGGLAVGLILAGAISGALIAGLARLTYDLEIPEIPTEGAVGQLTEKLPDVQEVRDGLENALVDSALVSVFIDIADGIPGNTLGLIPGDFEATLDLLEQKIDEEDSS